MYRNLITSLSYYCAVFFLSLAMFAKLFIKNPKLSAYLNTDGLAFLGCLLGLFSLLALKIDIIRSFFNWVFLNLSFLNLEFQIELVLESGESKEISKLIEIFKDSKNNHSEFKDKTFEIIYDGSRKKTISFSAMISNITFKKDESIFFVTFKGVSKYKNINKILKFLNNLFLDNLKDNGLKLKNISLLILKDNSELILIDKGFFSDIKKYEIINSNIEIKTTNNSIITLGSNNGISLSSKNKADFFNSLENLKTILIK